MTRDNKKIIQDKKQQDKNIPEKKIPPKRKPFALNADPASIMSRLNESYYTSDSIKKVDFTDERDKENDNVPGGNEVQLERGEASATTPPESATGALETDQAGENASAAPAASTATAITGAEAPEPSPGSVAAGETPAAPAASTATAITGAEAPEPSPASVAAGETPAANPPSSPTAILTSPLITQKAERSKDAQGKRSKPGRKPSQAIEEHAADKQEAELIDLLNAGLPTDNAAMATRYTFQFTEQEAMRIKTTASLYKGVTQETIMHGALKLFFSHYWPLIREKQLKKFD